MLTYWADSSDRRNGSLFGLPEQRVKRLSRRLPVQGFPGPSVEGGGDRVSPNAKQLSPGDVDESRPGADFGEVGQRALFSAGARNTRFTWWARCPLVRDGRASLPAAADNGKTFASR